MGLIVRQLAQQDYEPYKKLFDEAYYEYLEDLRQSNLQQYHKEIKDEKSNSFPLQLLSQHGK